MKCGTSGMMVGTNRLNLLSCSSFSSSPVVSTPLISFLQSKRIINLGVATRERIFFSFWFLISFALQERKELLLFSARK